MALPSPPLLHPHPSTRPPPPLQAVVNVDRVDDAAALRAECARLQQQLGLFRALQAEVGAGGGEVGWVGGELGGGGSGCTEARGGEMACVDMHVPGRGGP